MSDEGLSAIALMHFNFDLELPYEHLIMKWSQLKQRLISLDITEWIADENIVI